MVYDEIQPRPFSDLEYALLVQQSIKRFLRKSEVGLQWIPPRHWSANEPDRRQVLDSIDLAIDALRQQVRGNRE